MIVNFWILLYTTQKQDINMQSTYDSRQAYHSYYCNAVTIVIKMFLRDIIILITDL